jgi:hypothetical protein
VKRSNKLVWKWRLWKNPLVECVPMFAVVKRFSLGGNEEQHVTFLVATAGGWSEQDGRAAGKTMKQTLLITPATITSCVDCLTVSSAQFKVLRGLEHSTARIGALCSSSKMTARQQSH